MLLCRRACILLPPPNPTRTHTFRNHPAAQIENTLAQRGADKLWELLKEEPYVHALGALSGNQVGAAPGRGGRSRDVRGTPLRVVEGAGCLDALGLIGKACRSSQAEGAGCLDALGLSGKACSSTQAPTGPSQDPGCLLQHTQRACPRPPPPLLLCRRCRWPRLASRPFTSLVGRWGPAGCISLHACCRQPWRAATCNSPPSNCGQPGLAIGRLRASLPRLVGKHARGVAQPRLQQQYTARTEQHAAGCPPAGGRGEQHRGVHLPRPVALPRQLGASARQAHQQREGGRAGSGAVAWPRAFACNTAAAPPHSVEGNRGVC